MQSVSIGFKSSESNIQVIENITANYWRIIYKPNFLRFAEAMASQKV